MKKLLWIVAFTSALIFGNTVSANQWQCGDHLKKLVSELNLDKDQKEKIKPIVEQFKASVKDSWTQMKDTRSQIMQQVMSDKMDKSTVDGMIDKKSQMIGNIMKAKASAVNQIYTILNDQQKAQLKDKVSKAESKMAAKFESCKDND